ncbi:MAG: hypothetical protein R2865_01200 [Deinococcales bacterium]
MMILGYGIIAVPTGIVTAEINQQKNRLRKIAKSIENNQRLKHCLTAIVMNIKMMLVIAGIVVELWPKIIS